MATTTNFGWTTPNDTDLVKDGAAAIRTALGGPDTSFVGLKGGTTGQVLSKTSATDLAFTWSSPSASLQTATFNDTKSSGTAGGTFTTGAWRTRDLNTTQFNGITSASLASNQISLPAGTYYVIASAPGFYVNDHQVRLQNITDSTTTITGQNSGSGEALIVQPSATLSGTFTIAGTKVFELQHRSGTTKADNGFGASQSWGDNIYGQVSITKVG